jgi:hypothetical protein
VRSAEIEKECIGNSWHPPGPSAQGGQACRPGCAGTLAVCGVPNAKAQQFLCRVPGQLSGTQTADYGV